MVFSSQWKNPPRGMRDVLPSTMERRFLLQQIIHNHYSHLGFSRIDTPSLENINLLDRKESGDNQHLIFKVLKRGLKENESITCDLGLRFDLTLPLARFYAANYHSLMNPFKVFQMGNVWRAERPQKGRYRQFMQCDIDIFGLENIDCEWELLDGAIGALNAIGISNLSVHINDRRILEFLAKKSGFSQDQFGYLFLMVDKWEKMNVDKIKNNLKEKGYCQNSLDKFFLYLDMDTVEWQKLVIDCSELKKHYQDIDTLIGNLKQYNTAIDCKFSPHLVRGMGYYTGTIFEIKSKDFDSSIAGGGRYDTMLLNFGLDTPACGISLGFERIMNILENREITRKERLVIFYDGLINNAFELRRKYQDDYEVVLLFPIKKNFAKILSIMKSAGYTHFIKPETPFSVSTIDF